MNPDGSIPADQLASFPINDFRHGFTGHEHDQDLDLINMRGRMYDPQTGRMLSPDPFVGTLPKMAPTDADPYLVEVAASGIAAATSEAGLGSAFGEKGYVELKRPTRGSATAEANADSESGNPGAVPSLTDLPFSPIATNADALALSIALDAPGIERRTDAWNPYSYVLNSPLSAVDPTGYVPVALVFVAKIAIEAALSVATDAAIAEATGQEYTFSDGVQSAVEGVVSGIVPGGSVARATGKTVKAGIKSTKAGGRLAKGAGTARGRVKPGDTGSYGQLKAQKRRRGETEALDMDHQPSFAAQVKAREQALGRPLTKAERTQLKTNTPAVASPRKVHQQSSPTYGGRNTPERVSRDAADLDAAGARDKAAFDDAMKDR